MSVTIKAGYGQTQFTYKGKHTDMWIRAINRLLDYEFKQDQKLAAYVYTGRGQEEASKSTLRKIRECVQDAQFIVDAEYILDRIQAQDWTFEFSFDRHAFVRGVRHVWQALQADPTFSTERQVLTIMQEYGLGVSVEFLACELWLREPHTFHEIRDALLRLEKLCLVEYQNGEYSYRNGILGKA